MTSEKGNKPVRVILEASLEDQLEPQPRLDELSQSRIGEQLRAMYDDLMQQPIPERFEELLAKLDQGNSKEEKS